MNAAEFAAKTREVNDTFVRILAQIERAYGVPAETCERLLELYTLSGTLIVTRVEEMVHDSAGGVR